VTSRRDVGYSARSKSFKDLVGRIENIGHEIGLHPSFNTYKNKGCMRREKGRLEKVVSGRLLGVRQHYLRFEVPTTWRIQEELGFLYDASLGFADREGFRSGFCSPFHPYDVEKDEQLEIWELPLTVMDGTLKDYRGFSAEESLEVLTRTVDTLKAYDGVGVFLFHNTCFDEFDFPGWDRVFQKTLEYAFDQGAYIGSCKDILDKYIGFSDVRKRNFS
jgi:peptidoglycan/xylan/chitin deacetylase (PgdA/CDA1 family)